MCLTISIELKLVHAQFFIRRCREESQKIPNQRETDCKFGCYVTYDCEDSIAPARVDFHFDGKGFNTIDSGK